MASISKRASGTWQNTSYGIRATATDTITTLPTTIYGDGTNATIAIKGNTIQSGTPTPESPIMPEGCGNKTANLSSTSTFNNTVTDTRSVFRCNLRLLKNNEAIVSKNIDISQTGLFYITATAEEVTDDIDRIIVRHSGQTSNFGILSANVNISSGTAVTFSANALGINPTVVGGVSLDKIMLNTGAYTPYEPYGIKIPISSAGQTTPVYLGEVETTRKIYKYAFTGQETEWRITGTGRMACVLPTTSLKAQAVPCICSHYIGVGTSSIGSINNGECSTNTSGNEYVVYDTNYTSVADFKAYLAQQYAAGTPVTVWYVLATEETAVVNEPLMKIDSYADEVNEISIPTIDGANTLAIDTTVQPSEVSLNYHGWHMGTVHERVSGEWD